jgi:hypothetical protein
MGQFKTKLNKGLMAFAIALSMLASTGGSLLLQAEESDAVVENTSSSQTNSSSGVWNSTVLGADEVSGAQQNLTEVPEDGTGTIRIALHDTASASAKENVKFEIVQIGTIQNGEYVLESAYEDTNLDLNQISTADDLEQAARTLQDKTNTILEAGKKNLTTQTIVTNEKGNAQSGALQVGIYLVYAVELASYDLITPSLISIPTWDESNECFMYDVQVEPKSSSLPQIQVNKVDADSGVNITNSDFEFTSYSDSDCTQKLTVQQADTSKGTATFSMSYGTIYIKETKAPEGYVLSDEVVKCEYDQNGVMKINDKEEDPNADHLYSIVYRNSLEGSSGGQNVNTAVQQHLALFIGLGLLACIGICGSAINLMKKTN